MYDECFKNNVKIFYKQFKHNWYMYDDVLKLMINFKKKFKNILYMYDGYLKINVKFQKNI